MIFNSLGSNYSWPTVRRLLKHPAKPGAKTDLIKLLNRRYQGQSQLYVSGRAALSVAVSLTDADYVATNSFNCYVVEQAIKLAGAKPVFVDIKPGTYQFSLEQIEQAHQNQPKIGAVIVSNTFGLLFDIKPLEDYCQRNNLYLIEDIAHSLGTKYADGREVGTVGDLVMLSFGRDKQIDVVSGGALIVRKSKLTLVPPTGPHLRPSWSQDWHNRTYPLASCLVRAGYVRSVGLGKIIHKTFKWLGLLPPATVGLINSHRQLPRRQASLILAGFRALPQRADRVNYLAQAYNLSQLLPAVGDCPLRLPIVTKSPGHRDLILHQLNRAGFSLSSIWYDSVVFPERFGNVSDYQPGSCPQTEKICSRILNLPLHSYIQADQARQISQIVTNLNSFRAKQPASVTIWEQALKQLPGTNLQISWANGQALKKSGYRIIRRLIYADSKVVGAFLAVVRSARRGRYLEVVGGPLWRSTAAGDPLQFILAHLEHHGRRQQAVFVRFQPLIKNQAGINQQLLQLGARPSPASINAPNTLKLDLTQSLVEIKANFRKSVRQRLKYAQRDGVVVVLDNSPEQFKQFKDLLITTAKRQKFVNVDLNQISYQYQTWRTSDQIRLWAAYTPKKEIIAMAMMVVTGPEIAYLYGASSQLNRRFAGAYAIQYQAIKAAQKEGLKSYNFWGVAPEGASTKHRFAGVTEFKSGFGGRRWQYLSAYDIVLQSKPYLINHLIETVRQKKRRV